MRKLASSSPVGRIHALHAKPPALLSKQLRQGRHGEGVRRSRDDAEKQVVLVLRFTGRESVPEPDDGGNGQKRDDRHDELIGAEGESHADREENVDQFLRFLDGRAETHDRQGADQAQRQRE